MRFQTFDSIMLGIMSVGITKSSNIAHALYIWPFKGVNTMMDHFFDFLGRGDSMIARDKYYQLEPDPGAVLLLTQSYRGIEFVVGYARSAIVEKWGCYCFKSFKRVSDSALQRSWAQPHEADLMIYRAVSVYLVEEEPWMAFSQ